MDIFGDIQGIAKPPTGMQRKACISPCSETDRHECCGSRRHSSAARIGFLCPRILVFLPEVVGSTETSRTLLRHGSDEKISMLVVSAFARGSSSPLPTPIDILLGVYVPIDSHRPEKISKIFTSKPKVQSFHLHPKSSCLAHNHLTNPPHLPFRLPWSHTPLHSQTSPTPRSFLLR